MDGKIDRLAARFQRATRARIDRVGIDNGHTAVQAHDFTWSMAARRSITADMRRGGQHERIAARQDDLQISGCSEL